MGNGKNDRPRDETESRIKRFGKIPQSNHMTGDVFERMMTDEFYQSNKKMIGELSAHCDKVSSQQYCSQIVYAPRLKSNSANRTRFEVIHTCDLPSSPTALTVSMARISMESFVTDLLSTIGFWLGLSALDVIKWIVKSVGRSVKKMRLKRRMRRTRRAAADRSRLTQVS